MILTSKHYLNHSNQNKLNQLHEFIEEYKRVAQIYLDIIWEKGIQLLHHSKDKTKYYNFNAKNDLDCPHMLSDEFDIETFLTKRARKCCLTQVLGIIRASTEKQRKRYFIARRYRAEHRKIPRKLTKALKHYIPKKPDISKLNPELNSVCLHFEKGNNNFDGWINLHSFTTKEKGLTISFPINFHRHSRKLESQGELMTSFLLSHKYIDLRWNIENNKENKNTKTVGADQGINTVLTLSDGQTTPEKDNHGHSLKSILQKLSRKKKGSKSFEKTTQHRTNHINWSINQLNFSKLKQLNLEDVKHVRYKNKTTRYLTHWTYTTIRNKVEKQCMIENVSLRYNNSTYYSQRCHICGLVLKSNRKGKVYSCKNCGYEGDADFNSSCNHQLNLPELSGLRRLNLNRKGFFWKETGLFNLVGEEFTVPLSRK